MMRIRYYGSGLAAAAVIFASNHAAAYRPFDGTDADVAEEGVFELELGPAHYYRQSEQNYLITPALVLNLGILERTELVVDANQFVALGPRAPGTSRLRMLGDDVLLKHVFREGVLQEKTGVSVASEGGVLTPEINGQRGFGASLAGIVSYRWWWGAVHWNERFEFGRDQHAALFSGLIAEGPHGWTVRPVTELFYAQDFAADHTISALVGAIWTVRDSLSFDIGLRGARQGDARVAEARLGLTWAIPVGAESN